MRKYLPLLAATVTGILLVAGCDDDGPSALLREQLIRVPGDFATIQAAVNAAKPNDTIEIAAGTYPERIVINKSDLTLMGLEGSSGARPILDGTTVDGGTGLGIYYRRHARGTG